MWNCSVSQVKIVLNTSHVTVPKEPFTVNLLPHKMISLVSRPKQPQHAPLPLEEDGLVT